MDMLSSTASKGGKGQPCEEKPRATVVGRSCTATGPSSQKDLQRVSSNSENHHPRFHTHHDDAKNSSANRDDRVASDTPSSTAITKADVCDGVETAWADRRCNSHSG